MFPEIDELKWFVTTCEDDYFMHMIYYYFECVHFPRLMPVDWYCDYFASKQWNWFQRHLFPFLIRSSRLQTRTTFDVMSYSDTFELWHRGILQFMNNRLSCFGPKTIRNAQCRVDDELHFFINDIYFGYNEHGDYTKVERNRDKNEKEWNYIKTMQNLLKVFALEDHAVWILDDNSYCFPTFEYMFTLFRQCVTLPLLSCLNDIVLQYLAWNAFVPCGMNPFEWLIDFIIPIWSMSK